ncbi:DUF4491 family protein [Lachnoclostridium phytofermentans]|uniref:Membrane protein n=1 Tax=Lachnoclostridium phytofermentans (strain ATCC 700394 / DSM 18823 / ISDg) TaxID=357809 RepID=A9KJ30_LACP7|nr:DUF4491 family protein [Lachnoclostridium phytofermentans]ABX41029.1 membrane protein [Lachnoclostridium phytofermentans ISDg]
MEYTGIIIGFISFLAIGLYHPIVIKAEYYFTKKIWPVFAVVGIAMLILSLFATQVIISAGLAVLGITNLWSIGELIEQEKRVEKGWFPKNPKRK